MRPLSLSYPHDPATMEPRRMPAWAIWRLANEARSQLSLHPNSPRIDLSSLAARGSKIEINGTEFKLEWEMDGAVVDDEGVGVLGSTEVLSRSIKQATIRLNAELIGDRSDLALSTALHELGHVVFDVPAWLASPSQQDNSNNAQPKPFLRLHRSEMGATELPNWAEWRANEFMGGFLVPRSMLSKAIAKSARLLRLPMVEADEPYAPPQILVERYSERFDDLAQILSDSFGLTPSFIATRLIKYRMIAMAR